MKYYRSQLIEIDECLYNFNVFNFYKASIKLFKVLGYPIANLKEELSNLSFEETLERFGENFEFVNPSERLATTVIETVSILFILNNDISELEYVKQYNDGAFVGEAIIVLGVEIQEIERDYYEVPIITNCFNRLFNTQILILFKKGSEIAFSVKRRRINKKDETADAKGSTFQTKWIETFPPSIESVSKISELSFDNFRDHNFYFMYNDIIKCIAEDFLIEDFPENDNISSHIKITDGFALYFRDSRMLEQHIFASKLSSKNIETSKSENVDLYNNFFNMDERVYEEIAITNEDINYNGKNKADKFVEKENITSINNVNYVSGCIENLDGENFMDNIVKSIIEKYSELKSDFTSLYNYFDEHRKNDGHLSTKEKKELSDYCFMQMEEIEKFIHDIDSMWDRFILLVQEQEIDDEDNENISLNSLNPDNDSIKYREIKFPAKYASISVSEELLKDIFSSILENGNNNIYIDIGDLKEELSEVIQSKSLYKNPQHVLNNIRDFLMDLGVIDLYEGAKRRKYIIKDASLLNELINSTDSISELLDNN